MDIEKARDESLRNVKAYVQAKRIIWNCSVTINEDGEAIDNDDQIVDMDLLLCHLAEIRLMLDLHREELTDGLTQKRILRRFSLIISS